MKNIACTLIFMITLSICNILHSQILSRVIKSNVSITARIDKESYRKSQGSFCAQGSSYFVLHVNPAIGNDSNKNNLSMTHVVETPEDERVALNLNSFVGDVVFVSGQILERKIPINRGDAL